MDSLELDSQQSQLQQVLHVLHRHLRAFLPLGPKRQRLLPSPQEKAAQDTGPSAAPRRSSPG